MPTVHLHENHYCSNSVKETQQTAHAFAQTLQAMDVVAFVGGMGVGKTTFVEGLAQGLGIFQSVSSPTFSFVHEYIGALSLFHFDLYRIQTVSDLESIGFFDYLDRKGVVIIEWSEKIKPILPSKTILVTIKVVDEQQRYITIARPREGNDTKGK